MGQPAVYKDSNDAIVCLAPTKLTVAPDSLYDAKNTKADGTLYFLEMTYGTAKEGTRPVKARDINNLLMHPKVGEGQKGKAFYSDAPGCSQDNDDNSIPVGKSEKTCIVYQISGPKVTEVAYTGYPEKFLWK